MSACCCVTTRMIQKTSTSRVEALQLRFPRKGLDWTTFVTRTFRELRGSITTINIISTLLFLVACILIAIYRVPAGLVRTPRSLCASSKQAVQRSLFDVYATDFCLTALKLTALKKTGDIRACRRTVVRCEPPSHRAHVLRALRTGCLTILCCAGVKFGWSQYVLRCGARTTNNSSPNAVRQNSSHCCTHQQQVVFCYVWCFLAGFFQPIKQQ